MDLQKQPYKKWPISYDMFIFFCLFCSVLAIYYFIIMSTESYVKKDVLKYSKLVPLIIPYFIQLDICICITLISKYPWYIPND